MENYKVLTIMEPYATLLVHGIKKNETRPKPTSWTIEKGTYLIHSARKWTKDQDKLCSYFSDLLRSGYINNKLAEIISILTCRSFNPGHIIGAVDVRHCAKIFLDQGSPIILTDTTTGRYITHPEFTFGDYTEGRYAWICDNARVLEKPIPYRGQQGYYNNFMGDVSQLKFR